MAQQHEVFAPRFGAKVGIERQESVDAARRGSEVFGDDLSRLERYPAEMLIHFLKSGKDKFLRFLKVAIVEMGEDSPDFVEINIVFVLGFTIQL